MYWCLESVLPTGRHGHGVGLDVEPGVTFKLNCLVLGDESSDMHPQTAAQHKWLMSSEVAGCRVQKPRDKLTLFSLGTASVLAVWK